MVFKFILACISLLVAAIITFVIGEGYFFDTIFYRKSWIHGYVKEDWAVLNEPHLLAKWVTGYRTKDVRKLIAGEKDEYYTGKKVVLIGDSFVYGTGVRVGQRLGDFLEIRLNTLGPTRVYSLGIPGDDIIQNYTKYKLAKHLWQPDLIVFTILNNDLTFNTPDKFPSNELYYHKFVVEDCGDYPIVEAAWGMNYSYEEMVELIFFPTFQPLTANRCALERIAFEIGLDPTVMIFSYESLDAGRCVNGIGATNLFEEKSMYINCTHADVYRKAGKNVISPAPFEYIPVSKSEGHPSNETYNVYAETLFNVIANDLEW
jgi:hypothetical protein